jgi:2-oxoisovalerate dehydrogenase E1 component alpha subunit
LKHLRSKLTQEYPHQAAEIEASALLRNSELPFEDTNSTNTLLRAHRQIVRLRTMDTILHNAQRQGRISFYMTCTGEEAIHMGSASALDKQDHIFAQYREHGLLMWRGFTLDQFTNQCFSNELDLGKGRQMPVHYGSREMYYHTVSSPLGTQLPQAVGVAYRLKLMKQPNIAICFFGDGCASTTDFHAAMNFAATLSAPVVFFCRNNGYAISTPVTEQYAGDGVVARAPGYGMAAIRVDGNDIFAVHAAVREARKYALDNNAPVLIEAMTYRLGHHSTSDDSTRYRSSDEVEDFSDQMDPLHRFHKFLMRHGQLTEEELTVMKNEERVAVLNAIKQAENRPPPSIESMFEDVYKEIPSHLVEQMKELKEHLAKYPDEY